MTLFRDVTLLVEKYRVGPTLEWLPFNTISGQQARLTPKRIHIINGLYRGRVFDRKTGVEVLPKHLRIGQWYRYSIPKEEDRA